MSCFKQIESCFQFSFANVDGFQIPYLPVVTLFLRYGFFSGRGRPARRRGGDLVRRTTEDTKRDDYTSTADDKDDEDHSLQQELNDFVVILVDPHHLGRGYGGYGQHYRHDEHH